MTAPPPLALPAENSILLPFGGFLWYVGPLVALGLLVAVIVGAWLWRTRRLGAHA